MVLIWAATDIRNSTRPFAIEGCHGIGGLDPLEYMKMADIFLKFVITTQGLAESP